MASETPRIRVTLLTKAQCGFCDDAKATLSRLARDYPIVIETVELDSPLGEQLALRGGVLFPPGIFLDDQPFSYGRLSEKKLRRTLAQCSTSGSDAQDHRLVERGRAPMRGRCP